MSHLQSDPAIEDGIVIVNSGDHESYSPTSSGTAYLADDEFEPTPSPPEYYAPTPNAYLNDEEMPVPEPWLPLSPRLSLSPTGSWGLVATPGLPEGAATPPGPFDYAEENTGAALGLTVTLVASEELSDSSRPMQVLQAPSSNHPSFALSSSHASSPLTNCNSAPSSSNLHMSVNTPDSNMSNTYVNTLSPSPAPGAMVNAQTEQLNQLDDSPLGLTDAYEPNQDDITASNTSETLPIVSILEQLVPSSEDVTPTAAANWIHRGEQTWDFPEDHVEECHINGATYYYSVMYRTFVPIILEEEMPWDVSEDEVEECRINDVSYYYSVTYGTFVPIIPDEDM